VIARALDLAAGLRRRLTRRPSRRAQAVVLVTALALFVAVSVWSWRELDVTADELRLMPLALLLLVLVPATIAANAAELGVTGRMLGVRLAPMLLVRTVVVATAANLLPIPGAAMVRVHALRTAGCRLGAATSITVVTALLWIAWSAVAAGVALLISGRPWSGTAFVAAGLLLMGGAVVALGRQRDLATSLRRGFVMVTVVELALIAVSALRLLAVLATLGVSADLVQALALAVSGALAAGTGVFPGGLGLTEAISGALGPLVGLTVATGVLATAFNRIAGLIVTAPIAAVAGASVLRAAARLEDEVEELPADEPSS
jgi:hypothetical protein